MLTNATVLAVQGELVYCFRPVAQDQLLKSIVVEDYELMGKV